MRKRLLLLAWFVFAAFAHGTGSGLSQVSFEITSRQFEPGDFIQIQDVVASSPHLHVGDTVIVHGRYHLESHAQATLGFFLTTPVPSPATPTSAKQTRAIKAGDGTFELEHIVPAEGTLHVSFYERPKGSAFGGVYFGPAPF